MKKFLLATTNKGKVTEIKECLADLSIELLSLDDLEVVPPEPEETGDTFEANAIEKAQYYFEQTGVPSLADDSGILVDALAAELGVHTRRWGAGKDATDEEWITYFLERMSREENKKARFVCVIAVSDQTGVRTFEGFCNGVITNELEAAYLPGLPISACFRPDGYDQVYSAMTVEQKNAVSHRGEAVQRLKDFIKQYI